MKIEMTKRENQILKNLRTFKDLSANQKAHATLLKEKKIILYAATLLDSDNINILELCLDILENFVANEQAHEFLISTFGIYESLEALSIRIRNVNEDIHHRAIEITGLLRNSTPPAYNTRSKVRVGEPLKRHQLFLLFIEELNSENQVKLERSLLKIKGIISFLIDIDLKRLTIRICPKLKIKDVVQRIFEKCKLKAVIVTKNLQEGTESYCDILDQTTDKSYFEYPEEDYSPKTKAISTAFIGMAKNGNNILKSITNFWNESFYW